MKNNSFFIFLSIILGLLFAGSVVFSYMLGNFGGISLKELNSAYLLKKELSFSDLPVETQKRYVDRDESDFKLKETEITRVFDDEGNPLVEDIGELRELVSSLRSRVAFLERENFVVETDKNELLKMVEHEKSQNSIEQKTLLSNNLEKINEAEQQHYKNISELTVKINNLYKENINLSQQLNQKEDGNKEEKASAQKQIEDEKKLSKQYGLDLEKTYNIKYASLNSENRSLKNQYENKNSALRSQRSTTVLALGRKDQKITLLQNKINKMMVEKNIILTKHSQEILQIQRQNSKKLKEFNDIVKSNSSEKELIKEGYRKTLKRSQKKQNSILEKQKNEIQILTKKLAKEKHNSMAVSANSKKNILKMDMLVEKKIKTITQKSLSELEKLIKMNEDLSTKLAYLERSEKEAKSQLNTDKISYSLDKDKILQLQDKIKMLEKDEKSVDDEVNEQVELNEKKHNKNYKILNEKISALELIEDSKQNKNTEVISKLSSEKTKLTDQLSGSLSINRKKEKEIKKLTKDALKREKFISDMINLQQSESKKRVSKPSNKLEKLGKVECDDMVSGNFKISSTCKAKVDKFLAQYDETDYFEVIPIVGTGGFATLEKVQRDGRLGISDSEIQRLTRLSNIGLARDRAKEGGWLIRDRFGDDVKISYAVYSIEAKDKRGFVIRAYR